MEIPFNLSLDANHKRDRFSEILLEKSLEFVLNRGSGTVALKLGLILLPTEGYLFLEKQRHKREALMAYDIGCVKIIFALLTKVIVLHI